MNDFSENYSFSKWVDETLTKCRQLSAGGSRKTNRTVASITATITIISVILLHFWGAQMGSLGLMIEFSYPGLIRTDSWIRCLEKDPTAHGYGIYSVLEKRDTDKALSHALQHIHSSDDYLWLNASIYLASQDRVEAIPYLIKSIRHTAQYSLNKRIELLEQLSHQQFGKDFSSWKNWYLSTHPAIIPDWESSLGHSPHM